MASLGMTPSADIFVKTSSHLSRSPLSPISLGDSTTCLYHPEYTTKSAKSFNEKWNPAFLNHPTHPIAITCLLFHSALHWVESLEELNAVTIAHSSVPPFMEQLAEQFMGRACTGMMDLFVGYDECAIAESSRDLMTFQSPFSALRLTTLPMGWTNSILIFHDDVTHIL
jgi:hypothetical protein